jgi:predicted RNA-binding Zn-ribbon protein involved in translation (DUF1610 family)
MIELTLKQFFSGVVLMTFLAAALSVYIDRRRDRKRARTILKGTIRCRVCGRSYRARETLGMADCPDCGRGNFRGRDRRLG